MDSSDLIIDWIGGNCPVQAEGAIAGKDFYFRARGNSWSIEIGETTLREDGRWRSEWDYEEAYGDEPYAAGWMPVEEARWFIQSAAERYLKEMA